MKKTICLFCVLAIAVGLLVACGRTNASPTPSGLTDPAETTANEAIPETTASSDAPSLTPGQAELSSVAEGISRQVGSMFSATWPENEFTQQVPKPEFETTFSVPKGAELTIVCVATVDQLKDYVKELRKAGFKKNDSTTDEAALGVVVYKYAASNKVGYIVELNYSNTLGGMSTLTIKKPA